MDTMRAEGNTRLKRDLSKEAIALALQGEWERAAEVNQAVLEVFSDDVDAMNRLGKALMELGEYGRAREVLDRIVSKSPYNTIAKKNLARLDQLESAPVANRQTRKAAGVPQLFIEESGKSGTTVLQKPATGRVVASIAPGDPVQMIVESNLLKVYVRDGEYLGQIELKLARRLLRLMEGGNQYEAAVIGVNERGISVIIRETYRHPSLLNACSFPTKSNEEHRVHVDNSFLRYIEDTDLDGEDDEEDLGPVDMRESDSDWEE